MPGKKRSDHLKKLWRRDPHCHWCGRLTELLERDPKRKYFPPESATRDHLRSRFDPTRQEPCVPYREFRIVLACRECNLRRSAEEVAENQRKSA